MPLSNFKLLQNIKFLDFLNPINITDLLSNKNLNTWNGSRLETTKLLSKSGIDFFNKNNIKLNDWSTVFYAPKNHISFIHYDNDDENISRINYVFDGFGKMVWYSFAEADKHIVEVKFPNEITDYYVKLLNGIEKKVIDVWDSKKGQCAITKINVPHNIITESSDRTILSIRVNESFEYLCNILN